MKRWNRRELLEAGLAGAGARVAYAAAPRKPNILVILADDLGFADLGFQGASDIPTPHLDRLARDGVRFTSGCVSHPFCSPTRAGLLTGRYQQRFGYENNPRYDPADEVAGLPTGEVTMAHSLKGAGYATGLVGKWHLGATPKFHPMRRGFQEMFGFIGGGHDYFQAGGEGERREYFLPMERDSRPAPLTGYLTEVLSGEAEAFIRRHRADPFFLYLAYNAPHMPQQVPERYLDRVGTIADEKRRRYAAMVNALDEGVGRVLGALDELKLDRDTLVFFLSDNGGPAAVTHARNLPLRGGKGQVYEGGIRVPFVLRWRGRLPEGKVFEHPAISLDIFPTGAAAAGARLPAGRKLDGVNLLPYLEGRTSTPPHERLFWRTGGGAAWAVREGRYKLVKAGEGPPQLFDLETDSAETTDLAAGRAGVRDRLAAAYQAWNREMIPPLFEPLRS